MKLQVKSILFRSLISSTIFLSSIVFAEIPESPKPQNQELERIKRSVIQIKVYSQGKDAYSPWLSGGVSSSTGTGFLIEGNRILTNAHVVSNAKYIEGQRNNQTEWYQLKTKFVAHDCDLAVLEAVSGDFYSNSNYLELGDIPELGSPVDIIGYPIGGSKISISRGIISRIEQSAYAHSQIDSHLVAQVDAAINPGNSGGPAIQFGKVVGVAFQASTKGENIGYIIPTNVIKHFLKDIEDGDYDGYVEIGIHYQTVISESHRSFLDIPKDVQGVLVSNVLKGGSAFGFLEKGDLIDSIDGFPIANNGTVEFNGDSTIEFTELIDAKYEGETIEFGIIRKGIRKKVQFPAKKLEALDTLRSRYDYEYPYFSFAGLIFQPLNRDLLESWSKMNQTQGGSQFLYRFHKRLELSDDSEEEIIFYRKLAHPMNSSSEYFLNMIVEKVNDVKIKNLNHFKEQISKGNSKFILIHFKDINIPLILHREEARNAQIEINRLYHLEPK
ncbi:PDZ domain-containing protein [Leptospira ryugenii]